MIDQPIKTGVAILEQPNLKIIEEIEGLISQVNDKIAKLALSDLGVDKGYSEIMKASEEIDLFQKTTLFALRKAFE